MESESKNEIACSSRIAFYEGRISPPIESFSKLRKLFLSMNDWSRWFELEDDYPFGLMNDV